MFRRRHYLKNRETARKLVVERLSHFQNEYAKGDPNLASSLAYKRIAIRDTSSRWGSCSSKKNLNFNYRIAQLPAELRDYVIVHELCHLKELNHGPDFWNLVCKMIPNAKSLNTQVRKMHPRKMVSILS